MRVSLSSWVPVVHPGLPVSCLLPTLRTVLIASADEGLRGRLHGALAKLRWQVYEAAGGADAMAQLDQLQPEALFVDGWLPDLQVEEFAELVRGQYPEMDLLRMDGLLLNVAARSPRRHELLQVLREVSEGNESEEARLPERSALQAPAGAEAGGYAQGEWLRRPIEVADDVARTKPTARIDGFLPEMVGGSAAMAELGKMVRLVAPRSTTVLIEGETGTGKELVAKALHRLSSRANKPFLALNCAAIPEALLEAELFGHTRGAFTGAVRSRTGRIEAADGGTPFSG